MQRLLNCIIKYGVQEIWCPTEEESMDFIDVSRWEGVAMEKNFEFINVRRLTPGRFSEDMMAKLNEGLHIDSFEIEVREVELGEDPSIEQLNVTFFVGVPGEKPNREAKTRHQGATLYFTFTSAASIDENLQGFEEFVRQHAVTASSLPERYHIASPKVSGAR
ncbi:MAG: hypothetical protein ABSF22_06795 [Bryobacteraceae bacterium]